MKLWVNILNCCNLYIFIWQQIGSCGSQQRPDSAQWIPAMSTLLLVWCHWFQPSLLTVLLQQLLGGAAKCHHLLSLIFLDFLRGVAGLSVPVEISQDGRTYLSSVKSTWDHYEIRSLAGRTPCSYLIFVLHANIIISLLLKSLTFITKYIAIFCQNSTKDCEDQERAFQQSYM